MQETKWKSTPLIEDIGEVSNDGWFKYYNWNRTGKEKITKGCKVDSGHFILSLYINGESVHILTHRLVAKAFIPIPDKYDGIPFEDLVVHHINFIPWDNRVENLCYLTRAEHKAIHASKIIEMCTMDWVHEAYFPSAAECERQTGISASSISQLCNGTGKRKSAGNGNGVRHRFRHVTPNSIV